ncbi:MAG: hypothetical protein J6N51_10945 [Selenomonas sp.]|nr:hypothetical protein [Selenomonas sp.]MBP3730971.1 hypothetical protein [Mailhella sp.]
MSRPTPRQLAYIAKIEEYLGIMFLGNTKMDATSWLHDYAPIYEREMWLRSLNHDAELEAADARRDW